MEERPLTFEEECLIDNKLADASKKAQIAGVLGGIGYFIFLCIPQKYLPVRGSDFSNRSLLASGGGFVFFAALVFGTIFLLAYLSDLRYFGLKKDARDRTKMAGKTRITKVIRGAIDSNQEEKKTVFHTSLTEKPYQKLYWMEGNLYDFKEGDVVDFECAKHSSILLSISKP
ncbi:MAG: hypothetical protein JST68_12775 [Bacteroidetes bacterium]|nr:hypothetical protein [Bacteroidota bacterium]